MAKSYAIAVTTKGRATTYEPMVVLDGTLPTAYQSRIQISKDDSKKNAVLLDDDQTYLCGKNLDLYERISPYYQHDWAVVGFSDQSTLYEDANALVRNTIIAVLISILASMILIHVLSAGINRPIQNMVKIIRKKEDNQSVELPPTYINELDELGKAVVDLNDRLCENAFLEKKKLEYERDYDVLTHLLNHRAFKEQVSDLLRQGGHSSGAMVMWDLDNLKSVNDHYGHDFGDYYIKSAAKILSTWNRDGGIISRISGDEFMAYIPDCGDHKRFLKRMQDVKQKMNRTVLYLPDDKIMNIRASAGIAWYPDDAVSYEELKKKADFAMYDTKNSYKGFFKVFDQDVYARDAMLVEGSGELNRIIDESDVMFVFQPIVDVRTGKVFAYEALMRPNSDQIPTPTELMRIARVQSKLFEIEKLTIYGVVKACIDQSKAIGDCRIFMNSIPNQLYLIDKDPVLMKYRKVFKHIVLEIIENEQTDVTCMEKKRTWANKYGAGIALDDYGSGYNSESTLLYIGPQYIKIDMEIVQGIAQDPGRQKLVANLISYAKMQKMKIIAEGVETEEEMKLLVHMGVDYIQGFYFARPNKKILPLKEELSEKLLALSGGKESE